MNRGIGRVILAALMTFSLLGAVGGCKRTDTSSSSSASKSEEIPPEHISALRKAQQYSDVMHMSEQAIRDQLSSEYGDHFDDAAIKYAFEHLKVDWNINALEKAKVYRKTTDMSAEDIRKQLVSEFGDKFTQGQADYAIEHLDD